MWKSYQIVRIERSVNSNSIQLLVGENELNLARHSLHFPAELAVKKKKAEIGKSRQKAQQKMVNLLSGQQFALSQPTNSTAAFQLL